MLICASCERENPRGARFCLGCGRPLAGAAGSAGPARGMDHETTPRVAGLPAPISAAAATPAGEPGQGGTRCMRCATVNPAGMSFCRNCGMSLDAALGVAPTMATGPDRKSVV